jgi:hypothetical protein
MLAVLFTLAATPARADRLYVRPGPDQGEVRVSTPWGDYVAYDEGGGEYWVGTQKECDRNRAIGIMQQHHMRLSTVRTDAGATAEFVEANTYRTRVGNDLALDEIVPEVAFEDPVAGHGPSTYHTLSVTWIQSSSVLVSCFVFDKTKHYVYVPSPEDVAQEWRNVVFGLPNDLFTRPLVLIFVARDRKPAVVGVPSVARMNYVYLKGRLAEQDTPQDEHQLKQLLAFDPGLRHYLGDATQLQSSTPSRAVNTVAPTPTPYNVAAAHPIRTYDYAGSIHDQAAGDGTFEMQLTDNGYGYITRGTWSATFSDAARSNQGAIIGNPLSTSFYLESRGCPYLVYRIQRAADGSFSASYKGIECRNGGTLTVSPVTPPTTAAPVPTP